MIKIKFLIIGIFIGYITSLLIGGDNSQVPATSSNQDHVSNLIKTRSTPILHNGDKSVDKPRKLNKSTTNSKGSVLVASEDDDSASLLGIIKFVLSMDDNILNDRQANQISKNILGLANNDIESINDPKKYLENLLEITLKNSTLMEEAETRAYFSDSKEGIIDSYYSDGHFSPSTEKIYAAFDMSNYNETSVIAKWTDPNGEIIIFRKYTIDPFKNTNYVWVKKKLWKTGSYRVNYYRTSDLALVSSNSFSIGY